MLLRRVPQRFFGLHGWSLCFFFPVLFFSLMVFLEGKTCLQEQNPVMLLYWRLSMAELFASLSNYDPQALYLLFNVCNTVCKYSYWLAEVPPIIKVSQPCEILLCFQARWKLAIIRFPIQTDVIAHPLDPFVHMGSCWNMSTFGDFTQKMSFLFKCISPLHLKGG